MLYICELSFPVIFLELTTSVEPNTDTVQHCVSVGKKLSLVGFLIYLIHRYPSLQTMTNMVSLSLCRKTKSDLFSYSQIPILTDYIQHGVSLPGQLGPVG